jgi:hypothetical protein
MEVLARFRPDPHILEALQEIEDDGGSAVQPPGELDAGWLRNRCFGVARVEGEFVDVGHSASLAHLRTVLASRTVHHGLDDLDAAAVRLSAPLAPETFFEPGCTGFESLSAHHVVSRSRSSLSRLFRG